MKILLTNDFSDAMLTQEKTVVTAFISSIEKIRGMTKKQILALDSVVDLSPEKSKTKIYAYNIEGKDYVVFSFTHNKEIILVDYVKLHNNGVTSLTYPGTSTGKEG